MHLWFRATLSTTDHGPLVLYTDSAALTTHSPQRTPRDVVPLRPHTKIPTLVFPTSNQASRHVALMIESLIRQNNSANRRTVLGLATGSTPVGLYRELIRLHREAGLDFSQVITFNLDEYFPMQPDHSQSYCRWMHETFFD